MKQAIQRYRTNLSGGAIEKVQKALSDHFSGALVQLDNPISVRDNSEIFHAVIGTAVPLEAAVKYCRVPRTSSPDVSAAKEQFFALKRVACALENRNDRYRVPTPLCLLPDLGILAMSWIDGEALSKKIIRPAVVFEGPGWFEEIGAWLGNFHCAGPRCRGLINLDERLTVLEDLYASPLTDRSFTKGIHILQEAASSLMQIEAETSWLHGDCKPDNFMFFGCNTYGIDISLSHENPVEYDLAQFWNNLDLLLGTPIYMLARSMRPRLEEAFWRGYRCTGPTVSQPYLNWLRLNFSLSFWHNMLNGPKQTPRSWMLNRTFAKLADSLCRKITQN